MINARKRRAAVVGSVAAILAGSLAATGAEAKFRDRDCSDFATQAKAQKFFIKHGGPKKDRHRLDADHDGRACEDLP